MTFPRLVRGVLERAGDDRHKTIVAIQYRLLERPERLADFGAADLAGVKRYALPIPARRREKGFSPRTIGSKSRWKNL